MVILNPTNADTRDKRIERLLRGVAREPGQDLRCDPPAGDDEAESPERVDHAPRDAEEARIEN